MIAAVQVYFPWFLISASYIWSRSYFWLITAFPSMLSSDIYIKIYYYCKNNSVLLWRKMFKQCMMLFKRNTRCSSMHLPFRLLFYLDSKIWSSDSRLLYLSCRKFQGVMQIVAMAEIAVLIWYSIPSLNSFHILYMDKILNLLFGFQIFLNMDDSLETYWLRLLVREWAQFCIFSYIGYVYDHTLMRCMLHNSFLGRISLMKVIGFPLYLAAGSLGHKTWPPVSLLCQLLSLKIVGLSLLFTAL